MPEPAIFRNFRLRLLLLTLVIAVFRIRIRTKKCLLDPDPGSKKAKEMFRFIRCKQNYKNIN